MAKTKTDPKFRQWYANNRDEVNERRREVYAANPELQQAAAERSRRWRQDRKEGAQVEREYFREHNGKTIRVYSTGQVADRVGVSTSALKKWDAAGLLPEVLFPGSHRYYTAAQVKQIERVAKRNRL